MYNEPCGYCIFNNAAIGARHAIDVLGLERILIVDWDIHHGQGTQYAFYDDPRVLYFSIHRYEYGNFWPNLRQSDYDFIGGHGSGRGYNVNVPINKVGLTNGDYMAIIQQVLMPMACEYNPQLVIVSCGFDVSIGDPEGRSHITPAAFAHFTHMMKQLASGKLTVLFEGGYCLKSTAEGAALVLRCLLDDPCPDLGSLPLPLDSTVESILHVIRVLRPFWRCFAYHENTADDTKLPAFFRHIELPKRGVRFFTDLNRPESFSLNEYEKLPAEEERILDMRIDELIANTHLEVPANRTCLIYEERMAEHRPVNQPGHPEDPSRVKRIVSMLEERGLLSRCRLLPPRNATKDEIALVHSREYIDRIESFETLSDEELSGVESNFTSIYLSQATYRSAVLAAGCTLNVVDEVMSGKSLNGFAVVRPPGHHAEKNTATGFCFFNHIAIAAKYALKKYNMQRILIVDWDIHHGNGTQNAFMSDSNVLYISIHRQDIFPPGDAGHANKVGFGSGEGYNINIPWFKGGMGDAEYLAAFQQIIMPVAYEFGPELVLVSAGFDAAVGDPLGVCKVSPAGFSHMTHMLSSLAGGKLILILEGGYNLNAISESASACLSVLLGDRIPALPTVRPVCKTAVQTISHIIQLQRRYWKSLAYRVWMPSRQQTLQWLGDDLLTLPPRAVDLLKAEGVVAMAPGLETDGAVLDSLTQLTIGVNSVNTCMPTSDQKDTAISPAVVPLLASVAGETKISGSDAVGSDVDIVETCGGASDGGHQGAVGGHKQTLLEQMKLIVNDVQGQDELEFFAVEPLPYCPHLQFLEPVPCHGIEARAPCKECSQTGENWICLTCYEVHCSRYVHGHMEEHWKQCAHSLVLSLADISVWCYTCSAYVHHALLVPAKQAAYSDKFGEHMPGL
jgi:histone deacetylase 6